MLYVQKHIPFSSLLLLTQANVFGKTAGLAARYLPLGLLRKVTPVAVHENIHPGFETGIFALR